MTTQRNSPYHRKNVSLGARLYSVLNDCDMDSTSFAIAYYLLENFGRIDHVSIEEIMAACFVSRSGVRRFFRSIGFENLSDARSYADEQERAKRLYCGYASDCDYGLRLKDSLSDVLDNTSNLLEEGAIDELAGLIHDADHVLATASGMSASGLYDLQHALVCLGRVMTIVTDATDPGSAIMRLKEGDLLLTISVNGFFAAYFGEQIRDCPATTVLVTTNDEQVLRQAFDRIYKLGPFAGLRHRSPYSKYATSYFCDLVLMRYAMLFSQNEEA